MTNYDDFGHSADTVRVHELEEENEDLRATVTRLREALEQIAAFRIARGGPENDWWEIACDALAQDAEQESAPDLSTHGAAGESRPLDAEQASDLAATLRQADEDFAAGKGTTLTEFLDAEQRSSAAAGRMSDELVLPGIRVLERQIEWLNTELGMKRQLLKRHEEERERVHREIAEYDEAVRELEHAIEVLKRSIEAA